MLPFPVDSQVFTKNMDALNARYPHISAMLEKPARLDLELMPTNTAVPNLSVRQDDGAVIPIYPETDPLEGLAPVLENLGDFQEKIVAVFGFALGYHAIPICEMYGRGNIVVIYEAFPESILLAMQHVDLRPVFTAPDVRLIVGEPVAAEKIFPAEKDVMYAQNPVEYFENRRWMQFAPQWYSNARESLDRFVVSVRATLTTSHNLGRRFFQNKFENLIALKDALPLNSIKHKFNGVPAVVVAAGPSLSKNVTDLKKLGNGGIVIAVDSAAAPLLQIGIRPDFVASIDAPDFAYEKLVSIQDELTDSRLVFIPEVNPQTLKYTSFKEKYYTYQGENYRKVFDEILGLRAGCLMKAQSVVHLAIVCAQELGCNPIIFMGLDLAYSGEKDHADGTILHWGARHDAPVDYMVKDIRGEMIPTEPVFLHMLDTCEYLIHGAPDRRYVDATEGGARIKYTTVMTAADAIETYCANHRPFPSLDKENVLPTGTLLANLKGVRQKLAARGKWLDAYERVSEKIDELMSGGGDGLSEPGLGPNHLADLYNEADRLTQKFFWDDMTGFLADLLGDSNIDYFALERKRLAALAESNEAEIIKATYAKQKFVQQSRKSALADALDQVDRVIAGLTRLYELETSIRDSSGSVGSRLALAEFLWHQDCLAWLNTVLDTLSPDLTPVKFYRGGIRLKQGKVQAAKTIWEPLLKETPSFAESVDRLYRSMEKKWLDECDMASFRNIIRPRLIQMGPSRKAIETLWPQDLNHAETVLASPRVKESEVKDVERMLTEWEPVKGRQPQWLRLKAMCIRFRKGIRAAIGFAEGVIDTNAAAASEVRPLYARFLIEDGQFEVGLEQLREVVSINPQAAVLWEEIGDALLVDGDIAGAMIAYENCLNALPDRADLLCKIGDCYASLGQQSAARVAYEAVLEKMPDNCIAKTRLDQLEE